MLVNLPSYHKTVISLKRTLSLSLSIYLTISLASFFFSHLKSASQTFSLLSTIFSLFLSAFFPSVTFAQALHKLLLRRMYGTACPTSSTYLGRYDTSLSLSLSLFLPGQISLSFCSTSLCLSLFTLHLSVSIFV